MGAMVLQRGGELRTVWVGHSRGRDESKKEERGKDVQHIAIDEEDYIRQTHPIVGTRTDQRVVSRRTTMRVRERERWRPGGQGKLGMTLQRLAKRTRRRAASPLLSVPVLVLVLGESVSMSWVSSSY